MDARGDDRPANLPGPVAYGVDDRGAAPLQRPARRLSAKSRRRRFGASQAAPDIDVARQAQRRLG